MASTDTEFSIGGTRFIITPMPVWPEGVDMFERLRETVFEKLASFQPPAREVTEAEVVQLGVAYTAKVVGGLDRKFVREISGEFFKYVTFVNDKAPNGANLAQSGEMAFPDVYAFYEVLWRSIAVNFTPSLRNLTQNPQIEMLLDSLRKVRDEFMGSLLPSSPAGDQPPS